MERQRDKARQRACMWNGIWTQRQESETSPMMSTCTRNSSMRCVAPQRPTLHMHGEISSHSHHAHCDSVAEPAHSHFRAHSCYWLPAITSTLFPQAGTKNNSLLQCEEHCPSASIMGQHTSIWLLRVYHSTHLFTIQQSPAYLPSIQFSSINRHK